MPKDLINQFLDGLREAAMIFTEDFVHERIAPPREPRARRKNIKPPKVKTPKPAKREAQGPTLYDELEVSPRASAETIRAAWVSLSKRFHPDIAKDATGRMKRINAAWSTLSDPVKRREYDRQLREAR
jgi:DnaJ-class molecular chaperone